MSSFVEDSAEIICPICRAAPEEATNFCQEKSHEKCCKLCISSYIENTVSSSFLGSCPIISCPSSSHQNGTKRKRILLYEEWSKALPTEVSKRYCELASSLLAFLCGGCHALKSLDVGFDANSAQCISKYFTDHHSSLTIEQLTRDLELFAAGSLTVEECYTTLIRDVFPNLMTLTDPLAWDVFMHVLKMIPDPERRANLHLRYLRDRPRIKTLCCNREHCFRCKVKDYHEGKSCMESSTELDHSVVNCPTCGIALAKGDGCNTITCVCGKQFSWTAEKENTDRCLQFLQSYPENTSVQCATILCTEMATGGSVIQQAQAWQIRNRRDVTRCLMEWFKAKYWPCPSQACVVLHLDALPSGVRECVEIWRSHRPLEVTKCAEQKRIAMQALFMSMYPVEAERAVAAHEIVNANRRTKTTKTNLQSDAQLLANSALDWVEHHRDAYTQGLEAHELRLAQQFLYLHGSKKLHETKPAYVNCPFSFEWSREISNEDLTYSNQNTSVCRVGSVSCYPAAFAKLVGDHSMFRVHVDVAPRSSNWLTFGLARRGMATTSSDGVGRTPNTWGVADDRSSNSLPVVSASGTNVGNFRKLAVGDVLLAEVDVASGWLEIRLNDNECTYRFEIPAGCMEDYVFAMTFANDHQVSIQYDDMAPVYNSSVSASRAGELNLDHTRMFTAFKKHLKILLAEDDGGAHSVSAQTTVVTSPTESPLQTSPKLWSEKCGGDDAASNSFEAVRNELMKFVKFGRDYPWKEPSVLPWLNWHDVLHAASWFRDNRLILKEAREAELAYTFQLTHQADAPFIAAVTLCDYHTRRVDRDEVLAAMAFMRFFSEEMNDWYDYDLHSKEPMVENVAPGCRCLPRHVKSCPCKAK